MLNKASHNIIEAQQWLKKFVIPIWFDRGYNHQNGSFVEEISQDGNPILNINRRALVQARQLYSVSEATKLNLIDENFASDIIRKNIDFQIEKYQQPNGAFIHSIDKNFQSANLNLDLYTQAFALFSLSKAYEVLKDIHIKKCALKVLNFLRINRSLSNLGFTEIKDNTVFFQSNPHMHLFEAALSWMSVDDSTQWRLLADELFNLCTEKFIDKRTQILAEHFESPWNPLLINNNFIFEPGHHYEWAWLLLEYQKQTNISCATVANNLFLIAEKYGLCANKKFVIDEVYSNFENKQMSSRFWPQCERIKAAVSLGISQPTDIQLSCSQIADNAFESLQKYFEVQTKGLWFDTRLENGNFIEQSSKASSLYHIINAISEYTKKRPLFS